MKLTSLAAYTIFAVANLYPMSAIADKLGVYFIEDTGSGEFQVINTGDYEGAPIGDPKQGYVNVANIVSKSFYIGNLPDAGKGVDPYLAMVATSDRVVENSALERVGGAVPFSEKFKTKDQTFAPGFARERTLFHNIPISKELKLAVALIELDGKKNAPVLELVSGGDEALKYGLTDEILGKVDLGSLWLDNISLVEALAIALASGKGLTLDSIPTAAWVNIATTLTAWGAVEYKAKRVDDQVWGSNLVFSNERTAGTIPLRNGMVLFVTTDHRKKKFNINPTTDLDYGVNGLALTQAAMNANKEMPSYMILTIEISPYALSQ